MYTATICKFEVTYCSVSESMLLSVQENILCAADYSEILHMVPATNDRQWITEWPLQRVYKASGERLGRSLPISQVIPCDCKASSPAVKNFPTNWIKDPFTHTDKLVKTSADWRYNASIEKKHLHVKIIVLFWGNFDCLSFLLWAFTSVLTTCWIPLETDNSIATRLVRHVTQQLYLRNFHLPQCTAHW